MNFMNELLFKKILPSLKTFITKVLLVIYEIFPLKKFE